MHDNEKIVEERIERVLDQRLTPAIHSLRHPVELRAWEVPDEPVPVEEALAATYAPFAVGQTWGRAWSTCWFDISGEIPLEWAGRTVELLVDPGFQGDWPGNQAEGLVFTPDGRPVKGIHPRNQYVRVAEDARGGDQVHYFLEAASNPDILANDFVPTLLGDKSTAPKTPIYTFRRAELAVFEPAVWDLRFDIEVLYQLLKELPKDQPRRHEILRAVERSLDVLALDDIVGTAQAAREPLREVLSSPANPSSHRLSAIGQAHIDTAWLWPLRETKRKVGRTFSNVLALMDDYPDFKFAASSAQQYLWVKERYPQVWEGIKKAVARGQWTVVGSQWVEADGNLPGGEAMVRQMTHGLRFFQEELGVEPDGIWLPDSFGYTAAFPQIAKLAGMKWFLTQKLSWNQTNTFPHHTFWWEGIDGSRVFTHFPPIDTYSSTLEAEELHHAVRQFREKGRATMSMVPFGYGDGGGGPIREMMERQRRVASLEGSPRVEVEDPDTFFEKALAEYPDAPVWVGELYLELHRGTFTSHAREKRGNRMAEHRLREAELWWTVAALRGHDYPYDALDELWERTLLQQFHDILPGSSIEWVHKDNEAMYAEDLAALDSLVDEGVRAAGIGGVVNTADRDRRGLVEGSDGRAQGLVDVPGSGCAPLSYVEPTAPVSLIQEAGGYVLENSEVRVVVDVNGLVTSILDSSEDRELLPTGRVANLLQLHEDLPNAWDAWDIDAHYRHKVRDLTECDSIEVVENTPLRVRIAVHRTFGASSLTQTISVEADDPRVHFGVDLDWRETEKLLKVSFPFDIRAQYHSAEIQFGHVRRATDTNTSWEDAKFEVMAHRWIHVAEPGYGIGVVNAGTYGNDVTRGVTPDGETRTEVRLSLVRAARVPDPHQDLGHHRFDYAVHPGATIADVVTSGYEQNLPLRVVDARGSGDSADAWSLVRVDDPGVRIEAVKMADDRSGDVIIRLYEAEGRRARTTVRLGVDAESIAEVDLRERPLSEQMPRAREFRVDGSAVKVGLRPFEILTMRVRPRVS